MWPEATVRVMLAKILHPILRMPMLLLGLNEADSLRHRFAPLDLPDCRYLDGFDTLFSQYEVPSSFISERIQAVTYSFGAYEDADESRWCHCKIRTSCMLINGLPVDQMPGCIFCARTSTLEMRRKCH
jgi:hypothetical protein